MLQVKTLMVMFHLCTEGNAMGDNFNEHVPVNDYLKDI